MRGPGAHTIRLAVIVLTCASGFAAAEDVPAAFYDAWQDAAANKARWEAFAQEHREHDLGDVARLYHGIELVKAGEDNAAAAMRIELKDQTPPLVRKQTALAAKSWLARMQMRRLRQQLKAHHRKRVEYPASLNELVAAGLVQSDGLVDPFGEPFAYEAKARKLMPDIPRQTYDLRCTTTKVKSRELAKVLRDLYEPSEEIEISSLKPDLGQAFVRFKNKDGSFGGQRWRPGDKHEDLMLLAVYDRFILILHADVPKLATLK